MGRYFCKKLSTVENTLYNPSDEVCRVMSADPTRDRRVKISDRLFVIYPVGVFLVFTLLESISSPTKQHFPHLSINKMQDVGDPVFPLPPTTHIGVALLAILHQFKDAFTDWQSQFKELRFQVWPFIFTSHICVLFARRGLLLLIHKMLDHF